MQIASELYLSSLNLDGRSSARTNMAFCLQSTFAKAQGTRNFTGKSLGQIISDSLYYFKIPPGKVLDKL